MKLNIAACALCITFLISCGKKENNHPFLQNGTYTNRSLATAGPITMYTGNETITNQNIIHDFLQRKMSKWLADSTFIVLPNMNTPFTFTSVTIEGDSVAYYRLGQGNSYVDTFFVNKLNVNTRLLVANRKSQIQPTILGELGCTNVAKYIRSNPPSYTCIYFNYPDSYCLGCKQFQLNVEDDHLVMPVLTYYFTRPVAKDVNCHTYERYVNDGFNENILSRLLRDDTLVVQTYLVKLYK